MNIEEGTNSTSYFVSSNKKTTADKGREKEVTDRRKKREDCEYRWDGEKNTLNT